MMTEAMVATMVSKEQKKDSSNKEEANWSSRLSGVRRKRENRLERTRLRTNLKMYKCGLICDLLLQLYLLLRVLKPLLLMKRITRIVLRMVPIRKVMQMMISRRIRSKSPSTKSSLELTVATIRKMVRFIFFLSEIMHNMILHKESCPASVTIYCSQVSPQVRCFRTNRKQTFLFYGILINIMG